MRSLPAAWFSMQCALLLLTLMLRTSSCNRAGDAVFVDGLQVGPASYPATLFAPLLSYLFMRILIVHQAPFNTSDPADPGYLFFSPFLKTGNSWCSCRALRTFGFEHLMTCVGSSLELQSLWSCGCSPHVFSLGRASWQV